MPWLPDVREHIRQLRFPPEFRITQPRPPRDRSPEPTTVAAPPVDTPPVDTPPAADAGSVPAGDLPDDVLADVATNLWRTKRKLAPDGAAEPRAQRLARRHLLAAWDTFAGAGLEIHDFDGAAFDAGMSLEVLAYEARPDVTTETVLETIRPSVYRHGRCIQHGQVIVAHPGKEQTDGS